MEKRADPFKAAINKQIARMTSELKPLRSYVMDRLGVTSVESLHAVLGGKNAKFLDIKNDVFTTPEAFYAGWLEGMDRYIEERGGNEPRYSQLLEQIINDGRVRQYVRTFIMRTFLSNADALSKERPTTSQAEIWMGPNNADYGLLVTPRFVNGDWENDKSEIRHFQKLYFTIGHVLETGLVVSRTPRRQTFRTVDEYLQFFQNVLVRLAGSQHQDAIAELYVKHVRNVEDPHSVPLLLPEVRFNREKKHKYRLDYMIVESHSIMRVGFELSPWSTHGRLTGTSHMSGAQINAAASANREAELKKHKDYFREHGITTMIYTDADLRDPAAIFDDMARHLGTPKGRTQLEIHAMEKLRRRLR